MTFRICWACGKMLGADAAACPHCKHEHILEISGKCNGTCHGNGTIKEVTYVAEMEELE